MPSASSSRVDELRRLLGDELPAAPELSRRRLRERLTVLPPGALPAEAWPLLEALWTSESRLRSISRAAELPRLADRGWGARVSLWRGDITALEAGAIVNAANSALTGCYQPFHPCVDNAIHTAAGPWLREECGRIMASRGGRPEPTSTATVTSGYFLPARHVLHTVGPIVGGAGPGPGDEAALRQCYLRCLEAAATLAGVSSVAFSAISQGVFGYRPSLAAPAVLSAVREHLDGDPRVEHVVLVTYSQADEDVYAAAAGDALRA